jgi:Zn-finger nucleic acid-binding protein
MKCLTCSAETQPVDHEGLLLHACPQGHGLWCSPQDLLEAVRTDPNTIGRGSTYEELSALMDVREFDVEEGDEERTCPMCGRTMGSVRYAYHSDVVIDACRTHGVWLDDGELEALEEWARQHFAPDSPEGRAYAERMEARKHEDTYVEGRLGLFQGIRAALSGHRG